MLSEHPGHEPLIERIPADPKSVPQKYLCKHIYQNLVIIYFHYCLVITCTSLDWIYVYYIRLILECSNVLVLLAINMV